MTINNTDDMHRRIVAYAGGDYAKPRKVKVDTLSLFDEDNGTLDNLIAGLLAFKEMHASCEITCEFERGWGDESSTANITACRQETPDELEQRIENYRQYVRRKDAQRRAQYEQMKKEFG